MNFGLFNTLYGEALEYNDVDMYIAERGWQDWMDDYDDIGGMLKNIYTLANSSLQDTRENLNISRAAFGRMYNIPIRTLENWDSNTDGGRSINQYIKTLIDYTLFTNK